MAAGKEMRLVSLDLELTRQMPTAVLCGVESGQTLPLWIEYDTVDFLMDAMQDSNSGEEGVIKTLLAAIAALEGQIDHIELTGDEAENYSAHVILSHNNEQLKTVSAPIGLALALAIRTKRPIFADETILPEICTLDTHAQSGGKTIDDRASEGFSPLIGLSDDKYKM